MITIWLYKTQWSRANQKYGEIIGKASSYLEFCKLVQSAEFHGKFLGYTNEAGECVSYHEAQKALLQGAGSDKSTSKGE